jgi:hypothetical protein
MEAIVVVTLLALAQFLFFGAKVGQARVKYDVPAPAISGNAEFERIFRIHQNTLEQLIVIIPSLWFFGIYVHALAGAALGVVYLVGRHIYYTAYKEDAGKRGLGMLIGYFPMAALLLGGLGGAIWSLVK